MSQDVRGLSAVQTFMVPQETFALLCFLQMSTVACAAALHMLLRLAATILRQRPWPEAHMGWPYAKSTRACWPVWLLAWMYFRFPGLVWGGPLEGPVFHTITFGLLALLAIAPLLILRGLLGSFVCAQALVVTMWALRWPEGVALQYLGWWVMISVMVSTTLVVGSRLFPVK
jgi:hypothetical protein